MLHDIHVQLVMKFQQTVGNSRQHYNHVLQYTLHITLTLSGQEKTVHERNVEHGEHMIPLNLTL